MNVLGKFISNFKDFYNEINAATLTGAIDVVIVRQEDGSYQSSPFHVRFGKMGVLHSREKVVDIVINGEPVDIHMRLGETGEAYFIQPLDGELEEGEKILRIETGDFGKNEDEEARSQDSGYENEDTCEGGLNKNRPTTNIELLEGPEGEGGVDIVDGAGARGLIEAEDCDDTGVGVVVRVPRQDSSKFVMKDIMTQTDKRTEETISQSTSSGPHQQHPLPTSTVEDKDSSSADEVLVSKASSGVKKIDKCPSGGSNKADSTAGVECAITTSSPTAVTAKKSGEFDENSKGSSRNQRRKRKRRCKNGQQQQQQQQQHLNTSVSSSGSVTTKTPLNSCSSSGGGTPGGKKKGSSGSQSSDASTTSEVADFVSLSSSKDGTQKEDGVFAMDDVEKPNKLDIPQSSSMPLLREGEVSPVVIKASQSAGVMEGASRWRDEEGRKMGPTELGPNFHPFSDTDISPPPSPGNSRPDTPIKSDTEYEVERHRQELNDETSQAEARETWNWTWGQLPTPPVKNNKSGGQFADGNYSGQATIAALSPSEESRSVDSDGLNSALTRADFQAGQKLNELADANSGGGSSHDQQTSSGTRQDDSKKEAEEEKQRSMFSGMLSFMRATKKARHNPQSEGIYLEDLNPDDLDPLVAALYFPKYNSSQRTGSVNIPGTREEDVESGNGPSLPQSPQSASGEAVMIGSQSLDSDLEHEQPRHPIFDYKGFHDIALSLCGQLRNSEISFLPESLFLQNLVTYDDFCSRPSEILSNPDLVVRMGGRYYNWATASPHIMSLVLFQRPLPMAVSDELVKELMPRKEGGDANRKKGSSMGLGWFSSWTSRSTEQQQEPQQELGGSTKVEETTNDESQNNEAADKVSELPKREEEDDTVEVCAAQTQTCSSNSDLLYNSELAGRSYCKSLRLTSEQIAKLNLNDGANDVVFSVTTAYQGTSLCKCRIFLWNYDEKIIVSDIDGTITKSDVLGHLMPIIGKDWAQYGVAQLFTKIKNNGYHFLYLSARAIGQARITRDYLRSVIQEDASLPDGPVLLNPTSLLHAFHREVIERKPEEFKISCLKDIQALFPKTGNPFYAGYGNRVNDVWAYRAVGIPISRVFTINHKGELKHELTQTFQSTYSNLSDIVHHMFPVYSQEMLHHGEYSSVRYWKTPLPDYEDEINMLLNSTSSSASVGPTSAVNSGLTPSPSSSALSSATSSQA